MLALLVNGVECPPERAVSAQDRGLSYGDGLFETMLLRDGRVRYLAHHLARLAFGCERLGIRYPGDECLKTEIERVRRTHTNGVVKVIVTRGTGSRGYRPLRDAEPTRIVSLHASPQVPSAGIRVRWCSTPLSRNTLLAGIKHLNRLEQVLAQAEWDDPDVAEGLMCDSEGELISATAANVFIVRGRELWTPDLRYCGIRGIMRARIIEHAHGLGFDVQEAPLRPDDLESATEVFVTNAVRGVRAVIALGDREWPVGPVTQALTKAVETDA
jgi:4-amino-4-deoxychorismate lyase